jgi:serine/threonine protein kinase
MLVLKLCERLCPDKIPVVPTTKLGDGADGEVFDIEGHPDKVIKFCVLYDTGNRPIKKTFKQIDGLLDYLTENPASAYARVHSHGYLGEYSRPISWSKNGQAFILYYYVMEKLQKITEDERKVFHSIVSHEDRGIKKNFSSDKIKEMLTGMAYGLDFDVERVMFFYDNFKNTPVSHLDIHVRNIMKDSGGNFKLVDFDRAQFIYGDDYAKKQKGSED